MKQAGYKRFPTINKERIVFVSEDDLWDVPISVGRAVRLTSNEGLVSHPHFSPNGKYIAFTGREEGQADVYVIPSGGDVNKRLTFMGKNTRVIGWTPDSKQVLLTSFAFQPLFKNEIYIRKKYT
jgi:tricorn protease